MTHAGSTFSYKPQLKPVFSDNAFAGTDRAEILYQVMRDTLHDHLNMIPGFMKLTCPHEWYHSLG